MMAYLLGPIRFDPAIMIGAIGGHRWRRCLFGSNSSTWKQTMAAMKDAESQRAKLIDRIDFGAADFESWRLLKTLTHKRAGYCAA